MNIRTDLFRNSVTLQACLNRYHCPHYPFLLNDFDWYPRELNLAQKASKNGYKSPADFKTERWDQEKVA